MEKTEIVIPKKNYAIVIFIFLVTFIGATIFFAIYNNQQKYEKDVPVLRGHSKEIELKDLDTYFTENQDFLLFVGVANDDTSRAAENVMIEVIDDKNIEVIYVNIQDSKDKAKFYQDFNKKYSNGIDLTSYPAFLIIQDGKILDSIQNGYRNINYGDVVQLLKTNSIIGEQDD